MYASANLSNFTPIQSPGSSRQIGQDVNGERETMRAMVPGMLTTASSSSSSPGSSHILKDKRFGASQGKIWAFTAWSADIFRSSFCIHQDSKLKFLALLISDKVGTHGEYMGFFYLQLARTEKTIQLVFENAGFRQVNLDGMGRIGAEKWKVNAIVSVLRLCSDQKHPRFYYNVLGPEMSVLLNTAFEQLQHEDAQLHSGRGIRSTPASRQQGTREDMIAVRLQQWANTQQLPVLWTRRNRENPEADRMQCGAFRADFTYELADQRVVLLEYDEHAHRTYATDRELKRQPQMALGFGARPVHFIRFNPDGAPDLTDDARLALLLERMQAAMAPAPMDDAHFKFFLTVEYLFYPLIDGGNGDAVQTFRFKTVEAYEQWAVLRMTGMPLLGTPDVGGVSDDASISDSNETRSAPSRSDTPFSLACVLSPQQPDARDEVERLKMLLSRADERNNMLETAYNADRAAWAAEKRAFAECIAAAQRALM